MDKTEKALKEIKDPNARDFARGIAEAQRRIEVAFNREGMARFALGLLWASIFSPEKDGRVLSLKGEDGKVFDIVFHV